MKRRYSLISISAVIGLGIVIHYIGWSVPIENFLRSIINRGSAIAYNYSVIVDEEQFSSVKDLETAYRELKQRQTEVAATAVRLHLLEEQNIRLRQELQFVQNTTYHYIGADIIGKNVDPVSQTLIINKGTNHGVQNGHPAIVANGILIGKIIRTETNTSIVRLLQDGQSKIAATLLNEDKSIGLVEGGYGVSVQMNLIHENEKVEIGDQVITSGLEESIPRGLLIGDVEAIKKEAYEPFQQAVVKPAVRVNTLDTLIIITNKS